MESRISVQMYTVRDAVSADLPGTLARLAEIGFTQVEPYAFVDRADEYAAALPANGLTAPSAHAAVIDVDDARPVFDAANALGIDTVIDPFVPAPRWRTADDAKRIAERVNVLASQAAVRGLRFGYHNHQWEFTNRVGGRPVYEIFVDELAPEVVLELDTFWSTVGGADTVDLLGRLGERVQYIHVKDGRVAGDIATALPSDASALEVPPELLAAFKLQLPAGSGDVDVTGILAAAPQALRIVEFDGYEGDVFQGVAASFAWLQEHGE